MNIQDLGQIGDGGLLGWLWFRVVPSVWYSRCKHVASA